MEEGIIVSPQQEIEEFIINEVYPQDSLPVLCVLSGSYGYGLNGEESDRDYIGLHFMSTWECLEHPNYRVTPQVLRNQYKNFQEVPPGTKNTDFSIDSFELWKFTDLLLKGAFVTYELLYMPAMHQLPGSEGLIQVGRQMLTSKIGSSAKGIVLHDWRKNRENRKKTVTAYLRILQAIYFLRELEFEWRADTLIDYVESSGLVVAGKDIISAYQTKELRKTNVTGCELEAAQIELGVLVEEVEKAMVTTRLPDYCPRIVLDQFLQLVKKTRSAMI